MSLRGRRRRPWQSQGGAGNPSEVRGKGFRLRSQFATPGSGSGPVSIGLSEATLAADSLDRVDSGDRGELKFPLFLTPCRQGRENYKISGAPSSGHTGCTSESSPHVIQTLRKALKGFLRKESKRSSLPQNRCDFKGKNRALSHVRRTLPSSLFTIRFSSHIV